MFNITWKFFNIIRSSRYDAPQQYILLLIALHSYAESEKYRLQNLHNTVSSNTVFTMLLQKSGRNTSKCKRIFFPCPDLKSTCLSLECNNYQITTSYAMNILFSLKNADFFKVSIWAIKHQRYSLTQSKIEDKVLQIVSVISPQTNQLSTTPRDPPSIYHKNENHHSYMLC